MVEGVGEEMIVVSDVIVDSVSVLVGGSGVVVMPCVSGSRQSTELLSSCWTGTGSWRIWTRCCSNRVIRV